MQLKDITGILPQGLELLGAALTATGVGAPVGGAVAGLGALLGHALGTDPTPEAIAKAVQSDPQAAEKLAELQANTKVQLQQIAMQGQLAELQAQTTSDQADAADRDSARKRQVALRDVTPTLLAAIVIIGVATAEGWILIHGQPTGVDGVVLGRILGTLDSALIMVLTYFFGSSRGSDRKTEIMAQQAAQP